jgi:RND family efflux transporter MFP subunit
MPHSLDLVALSCADSSYALAMRNAPRLQAAFDRRSILPASVHAMALCFCLSAAAVAADSVNVRTVPLDQVLKTPVYSAPATVVARNQPQLAAEVDARIIELPAAVGDRVRKGDLLARLDCRYHESVLAAAQAELTRARAQQRFADEQLARARNLTKKKSISEELLDQRRTELAIAAADTSARQEAVQRAGINVENCELRAPFDAVVTKRTGSVGSFVTRGSPMIDLLEIAGQEVSAALRHQQTEGVENAASLKFESNGAMHPIRLRALLPSADPVARTREARLVFDAEPPVAGTAGRVVWRGRRALLPADYLVRRQGGLGVFVFEDDRARFIRLHDAQDGRPTLVTLPPDTLLITEGRQRLNDGDAVSRSPAEGTAQ